MAVNVYRSTDGSAPTLNGTVGSLITVLDACLVNGYGAKAAAGWTKSFSSGTTQAAYRQNATGANNNPSPMYLYVNDNGPGAGGAREARVCGFETMSAITPTGTGQFPTSAQSAIGSGQLALRKSATADATARAWTLVANGQTIYLFVETGDAPAPLLGAYPFVFGDFKAYKSPDLYAVGIIGRNIENSAAAANDPFQAMFPGSSNWTLNAKMFGHFVARSWTGLGGSVNCGKFADYDKFGYGVLGHWSTDSSTSFGGSTSQTSGRNSATGNQFPLPNGPDGALWTSPIYLNHHQAIRGYWPGLWCMLHDRPLVHNDVISVASGNLSGKTLLCQQFIAYITGTDIGQILVETSDTWT